MLVLRMANRIWKEAKQQPGTARPGNRLGSCLVSFYFLWAILSTSTVPEKPLKESARKFQEGKVVGGVPEKPQKENA